MIDRVDLRPFAACLLALLCRCPASAEPLLCCGGTEVFVIDSTVAERGVVKKLWRWTAAEAEGVPPDIVRTFVHMDECKPIAGGRKILVCSSSAGCALVERPSGRVTWYAVVTNAHSAELLPRNRVVVASSLSGDHLVLFDLDRSNQPLWKTPLHSAHGVVWDEGRRRLWALGFDELRCYELRDWETAAPSLRLETSYPLPDRSGHDLTAVGETDLLVTMDREVHWFDRATRTFRKHAAMGATAGVKSVGVHPVTGQTVYAVWKARLGLVDPDGAIVFERERPYKARWLVDSNE